MRKCFFYFICFFSLSAYAQETISIQIPDFDIYANQLMRGDADTYGLGNFKLKIEASVVDGKLYLSSKLKFEEGANDFTTIRGEFTQMFEVKRLTQCRTCEIKLENYLGTIEGDNFGARGYRVFKGDGLFESATIQTDTFGTDTGKIGGRVKMKPIQIIIQCLYAQVD